MVGQTRVGVGEEVGICVCIEKGWWLWGGGSGLGLV